MRSIMRWSSFVRGQHLTTRVLLLIGIVIHTVINNNHSSSRILHQINVHAFTNFGVIVSRRPSLLSFQSTTRQPQSLLIKSDYKDSKRQESSSSSSATTTTQLQPQQQQQQQEQEYQIRIGDTKGAILLTDGVAVSRGPNQLLKNVNWRVERGERWGIVGPNGAGKSTLLSAITGTLLLDSGLISIAPKTRVGYLKQTAVSGSNKTVFDEASSEMTTLNAALDTLNHYQNLISQHNDTSPSTLQKLEDARSRYESLGGYSRDKTIYDVLSGLGFSPSDMERPCASFSGGWQMRIALARLLLSSPTLLLLDEPSNHLDSSARSWLGRYLERYSGAMIVVSHDENLLKRSVAHIADVTGGTLALYPHCTFGEYEIEKEFRRQSAQAAYERNRKEAERLQSFVDRFGASATKASSAQSRVKRLEKMEREGLLEAPPASVVAEGRFRPVVALKEPPKSRGEVLLNLKGVDVGYVNKDKVSSPPLLTNVNLEITRGMKLLLRGPNGAGKSTLLKTLWGALPPLSGDILKNDLLKCGTFTQDLAQELPSSERAMDVVLEHARSGVDGDITISNQEARDVMGALGLRGDAALRDVKDLSGGEKARVALAMFVLKPSNLLMLDEPSNHLDVECVEALSEALRMWEGTVVLCSHDRYFCETVGFTHVMTVDGGGVRLEERNVGEDDWKEYDLNSRMMKDEEEGVNGEETTAVVELTKEQKELQAQTRKQILNAPRRIAKLEQFIETKESIIAKLQDEMLQHGNDVGKLMDLTELQQKEEQMLEEYMNEWEELEQLLATAPETNYST